jgi:hypothetical protein
MGKALLSLMKKLRKEVPARFDVLASASKRPEKNRAYQRCL